jgi:hypothetical protein
MRGIEQYLSMPLVSTKGLAEIFSGLCNVGQQGQVASTLDSNRQLALVTGASACLAAWSDFAFFGYKPAEDINLCVIDRNILICTELANLGARYVAPSARLLFHIHIHFI